MTAAQVQYNTCVLSDARTGASRGIIAGVNYVELLGTTDHVGLQHSRPAR